MKKPIKKIATRCRKSHNHNASRPTRAFYIRCGLGIVILQGNSFSSAFVPSQDRNKCEKPLSLRRSISLSSPLRGKLTSSTNQSSKVDYAGESFAVRMSNFQHGEMDMQYEHDDLSAHSQNINEIDGEEMIQERRKFLEGMFVASAAGLILPTAANAYDKAYPVNLDFENNDSTKNLQSIREERISVQKAKAKQSQSDLINKPFMIKDTKDVIGSAVWAGSLWLLSGSRSNPLVKPIANALYDTNTKKGAWVKDRNEGLFAPFPAAFSILMGFIFLILGFITDRVLLYAAEGESTVVLQLAGVSLIGGASLELGRIASGEKMKTRENAERDQNLADEFEEFAGRKLIYGEGGSVHRSEVIKSFRRYYAKYRVENEQFPLGDLEIEQLLRGWNRRNGNLETMSGSGFLKNVKINEQAEIKM